MLSSGSPEVLVAESPTSGFTRTAVLTIGEATAATGTEISPVMKALRQDGIEMTALHSHMIDENPRLCFMHFWANDDAQKLARNLRAALDMMNLKRGS
jgi:hypothetical protein